MSLLDLNPVESEQQYNNAALNPLNPNDIGARWYEGVGTGLVQGGKTAFYRDLYNVGKATKDEPTAQRALTNLEQLKPNPETVGVVGQLMYGLTDTLGTLAYNFAGGNVTAQTLAQSAGTSYAGSQEALHIKEGMDPKTARNVAIVEGAGLGLGAVVPGNVAGGLVMRATSGAAINLVMGAGQRALIQNELNKAGYAEMAKQYAPFDGVQSATDIAIGAFFGGLLGERPRTLPRGPKPTPPGSDIRTEPPMNGFVTADNMVELARMRLAELRVKRDGSPDMTVEGPDGKPMTIPGKQKEYLTDDEKFEIKLLEEHDGNADMLASVYGYGLRNDVMPSDIDTVLTQNNAAHVELGTAPGVPTDLATRQAHVDMINQAIIDLQQGNPVQATPDVTVGSFMENPGAVETRNQIGEAVRGHLSDLEQLQLKLEERGLPGDANLYSLQPLDMPPVRVTSDVRGLIERATRDNLSTEQIISELEAMLGKLETRNAARGSVKDKVRGTLWIQERLTRAERLGELSPEQVSLAKWLLAKNPAIGNDLAISLRTSKADGVGGMYNPIGRLAVLFKNGGDELTAAHEILHHTERMMPEDIQQEIRKAWLAEVKRVRDAAERSGNENLALFINDVIKANLGMQANAENALNAIKQGLVNKDAYALFNPSEFWAVKASQIVAERAGESWVQRAVQWMREFMEKAKDLFGLRSDAAVIRGLDAVLKSDGYKTDVNLTDNFLPKFSVEGQSTPKRVEEMLRKSAENENRAGVVVGGRPGEMGWSFANTDGTPPPIQHPVQRGPRLEQLGEQVRSILQASGFQKLAKEITGATKLKISQIEGTWLGNAEPSFVIHGEGLTEENAGRLARLMGLAFSQDATVLTKHSPDLKEGTPTLYIGNGKVLSKSQLDAIINAARERGVDLSTSADKKAIKFMHFGEEADLPGFFQAVKEIADAGEMPAPVFVRTQGELYEAADYLSGQGRADGEADGLLGSGEGRSDLLGRVFDHLVVPYAKAVASEGYRFSAERYAERFALSDAERQVLEQKLMPKEGLSRSTVPLMTGEETLDVQPTTDRGVDKKTGERKLVPNVTDVMWALQNRAARLGQIEPGDYSPKAMKTIAQAIADEVVYHVKHATKSAIGWYDAALKAAKVEYTKIFPELATDKDKSMLFDAVLGITSQGNDVHSNSLFAARTFQLVKDGLMTMTEAVERLKGTFGNQTRAIELNLLKLEHLLDTNGYDRMRDLFNKTMTVSEWNATLRKDSSLFGPDGKPLSVDGAATQRVTGWMVFGPKIGSFINNLHGDYSTLTADLWFSRTWNRLLGYMFQHAPELEAKQYQEFKEALLAEYNQSSDAKIQNGKPVMRGGKPVPWENGKDVVGMTRDDFDQLVNDPRMMLELAKQLEDTYSKGGYKEKSDLRRRAKNWIESRELTVAAPRSDLERDFQQNTVEMAQKMIQKKEGIKVEIADIQAALWFHEKELFGKMGASDKRSAPADYTDAAHAALEAYRSGELFYVKANKDYIGGDTGQYLGLTIPTESGELVQAVKALENADAEIAKAQQDSQGYGAAVACALRG